MAGPVIPQSRFDELLLAGTPLMDVRAPVEFAKGAIPNACNLPLMTDGERAKVGTRYKEEGQQAAIALGHELVRGKTKAERVQAWRAFAEANPQGALYCFRGGLRSQITQQWLAEAGVELPYVEGGYKALRQHLIDIAEAAARQPLFLVAGCTGVGKTGFIEGFEESVDLEGLARHRGSAFGKRVAPQPSPIDFENQLALALLKKRRAGFKALLLEDESRLIGAVSLPLPLFEAMKEAPLFLLEEPFEARAARIHHQYIQSNLADFQAELGAEAGFAAFAEGLRSSFKGISRRLGDRRYRELAAILEEALAAQEKGDGEGHLSWIRALLQDYYDPMYQYQLGKVQGRVLARGDAESLAPKIRAVLDAAAG
ncbi:tRNA 2-selenouridine(34) synthase MnmH [Gallaecimonas kandeliae]|uniref:tRNA 2-selenouridine(34) synthase MnmH n=1 Tax=Gallaecimonas kandeliae TaxID=3029055 RepID=UPI002647A494|nr:tRNA 2-selenouridine(34) synthase MnmH [Gallaecimonas kandeliae]WKE65947.1 tRNA 2-selenouridine(34) synthase MnmH [Gallaecimonas kandeliae]